MLASQKKKNELDTATFDIKTCHSLHTMQGAQEKDL